MPARDLSPGIVHFGVGNFHRAHQAVYLDRLMNVGRDHDWAIVGAGVTAVRREDARRARGPGLADHRRRAGGRDVVAPASPASMIDFLPPMDGAAILAAARRSRDPHRLADRHRGRLLHRSGHRRVRPDEPDDRRRRRQPRRAEDRLRPDPRRRCAPAAPPASQPFTVMSCDNVPHNGDRRAERRRRPRRGCRTRSSPTGSATTSPSPTAWSTASRPRPATASARSPRDEFGIEDAWPVFCEDFIQWVLEDHFPAGRPALREGRRPVRRRRHAVRAHEDPHPQRRPRDHRLPAGLMDIHFVHEAMERPAGPRLPRQGRDRGDHPDRAAGPRHRPRRLLPADRAPLRQSQDRRHHPPALPRRLQPPAQVHPPVGRRPAGGRACRSPASRSSRRSGAATATARPTAARRSSPTIRAGTACSRRQAAQGATPPPGSR